MLRSVSNAILRRRGRQHADRRQAPSSRHLQTSWTGEVCRLIRSSRCWGKPVYRVWQRSSANSSAPSSRPTPQRPVFHRARQQRSRRPTDPVASLFQRWLRRTRARDQACCPKICFRAWFRSASAAGWGCSPSDRRQPPRPDGARTQADGAAAADADGAGHPAWRSAYP